MIIGECRIKRINGRMNMQSIRIPLERYLVMALMSIVCMLLLLTDCPGRFMRREQS